MFFLSVYEKGLLNFVSERIKLVYSIENIRLTFQTSKTKINRPQTSELKSIFKFQLLFHWKNFEKYMVFYTLPWSRWNRTHKLWNTCVVPFAIASRKYPTNFTSGRFHQSTEPLVRSFLKASKALRLFFREMLITVY